MNWERLCHRIQVALQFAATTLEGWRIRRGRTRGCGKKSFIPAEPMNLIYWDPADATHAQCDSRNETASLRTAARHGERLGTVGPIPSLGGPGVPPDAATEGGDQPRGPRCLAGPPGVGPIYLRKCRKNWALRFSRDPLRTLPLSLLWCGLPRTLLLRWGTVNGDTAFFVRMTELERAVQRGASSVQASFRHIAAQT